MTPHRPAWIACLAALLDLLAKPWSSVAPSGPAEQLLWGAFCSKAPGKAKAEVMALARLGLGQPWPTTNPRASPLG
jgi:hypothetical protein